MPLDKLTYRLFNREVVRYARRKRYLRAPSHHRLLPESDWLR